jgi:hypothetical protein
MNESEVKLINRDNEVQIVKFYYPDSEPWFIEMSRNELPTARYEGHDIFSCLRALRIKLEAFGIKVLCNGARIDACVSGMLSQSGLRKVYITTMGKQASSADLVNIFEEAAPEQVGTVEEQENYNEKWFYSGQ